MVAFYRQFIGPGDLCFDVGAHVGNRLWAWQRLGACIVALEPQPDCMRLLRLLYGRRSTITLLEQAAGAVQGTQTLYISTRTPSVSSLSTRWVAAAREHPTFSGVRWDVQQPISVTTLDHLISEHGEPVFCKIDVEGYELEVLKGLSRPLQALSFEYLPIARDLALGCIARLGELGDYEYNWSRSETHRLASRTWFSPAELAARQERAARDDTQGDIYARLVEIYRV
jgi:FkbM family methyltransferase